MGEPFPGLYSYQHHPWCEAPSDSEAGMNVAMKAAQTGFSEMVINRVLYTLGEKKRDCLYVLPTSKNAADFSKARFGAALKLSKHLQDLFADIDNVGLKQTVYGNCLYVRGARGDSNLKSVPASQLILDELDEMDQASVWLALERLSGQVHKHVWAISTPTIPNFGIHKLFLGTTQEHYFFPCTSCGRRTELVWPDSFELIGEHAEDPRTNESFLKCKECKAKLLHEAKCEWLANAEWIATNTAAAEGRGFHISQLYSMTVSPGEIAKAYLRGHGDEKAAAECVKSKFGLPFLGENAKVDDELLDRCISNYSMNDDRPADSSRVMTMGIDQGKTNWITVCEWDIEQITLDQNSHAVPRVRWHGRCDEEDWDFIDQLMREWQIRACVVDADPNINEARRFARRFHGYVWLCRYRKGQTSSEMTIVEEEKGAPIAQVDRSHWIGTSLGRFFTNRITLPRDVTGQFRDHVKNVCRSYVKEDDGETKLTYVSIGPDHFAHSLFYNEIALPLAVGTVVRAKNLSQIPG